ncbi:cytochrome b/b6 domain-containing protein [Arthrobacter sp. ISL-85]|nr:cytochrome b/b6 domain-containing protein [Arthrobacter sp. ISL-85]
MGVTPATAAVRDVDGRSAASAEVDSAAQPGVIAPTGATPSSAGVTGTREVVGGDAASRSNVVGPAWLKPALITAVVLVLCFLVVLAARGLRTLEGVQEFVLAYDGHAWQPEVAPDGIPAWLGWQHFFNVFFMVLILRTGLQVRTERKPPGYWTAKKDSFFSPKGNSPKKVSLSQWLHQSLDVLWVANGVIFFVLLLVSGHWMRIVPMSWDIFPNMLSAAVQYASLDWPAETGWQHYNALQVVAYFLTVFVASPLAILSGVRISTWWPERAKRLSKVYPVEWARALHFPVMLYFVAFTAVHVFLVIFTGALQNLNHMFTSRDVVDWWGLVIFLISLLVIAAAWFLTRPLFTTPVAMRMGKVTK